MLILNTLSLYDLLLEGSQFFPYFILFKIIYIVLDPDLIKRKRQKLGGESNPQSIKHSKDSTDKSSEYQPLFLFFFIFYFFKFIKNFSETVFLKFFLRFTFI